MQVDGNTNPVFHFAFFFIPAPLKYPEYATGLSRNDPDIRYLIATSISLLDQTFRFPDGASLPFPPKNHVLTIGFARN